MNWIKPLRKLLCLRLKFEHNFVKTEELDYRIQIPGADTYRTRCEKCGKSGGIYMHMHPEKEKSE